MITFFYHALILKHSEISIILFDIYLIYSVIIHSITTCFSIKSKASKNRMKYDKEHKRRTYRLKKSYFL